MADITQLHQIGNFQPIKPIETTGAAQAGAVGGVDFRDVLKGSIDEIKGMNEQADQALQKIATGEVQDMHQVMMSIEKADLTFKTMMSVRNKLLDAYREVMKMNF
jgi:flagellar hook-basal body complex protein FliE